MGLLLTSKKLIDLTGIILVFLEPPDVYLWNKIKPILSHDAMEIEFPYVDKTESGGIQTKKVVVRGWPACIFCSAKDESNWPTWPEIVSRFLITSPNMIKEKYEESNLLIAQRKGLPSIIQDQLIISSKDIELAKDCIKYIKQQIKSNKNDLWIPYYGILSEALKSDKGPDVRNTGRIFSLLNIIPVIKSDNRPKLSLNGNISTVATLEDLSEVLAITQNLNGMPVYKMKFFKEVFYPLFRSINEPEVSEDGKKQEEIIAVTTKQLSKYYKSKFGRELSSDNIRKTYLNELHNNGLIEEEESKIDKRFKIYHPLTNDEQIIQNYTNLPKFCNFLPHAPLLLPKNCREVEEKWLIMEILTFLNYRIQLGNIGFESKDGVKQSIKEFISEYEEKVRLILYFKKGYFRNYSSKLFGEMKYLNGDARKDEKNCRIDPDSSNSAFLDPRKPEPEPEPEPNNNSPDAKVLKNLTDSEPPPRPK